MPGSTCLWNSPACALWTASGKIIREAKVASEPEALIAWFGSLGLAIDADRAGGGASVAMAVCGDEAPVLAVELLETRHVRDAFKTMPVKTDRKDARGIAQLMRLGWFRPVHCKSIGCAGDACDVDRAQADAGEAASMLR